MTANPTPTPAGMTAEQLRAELAKLWREMADFRCAGSEMTADAVHMYMRDYAEQLREIAARLSAMAAAVPPELLAWGVALRADRQDNDHCTADPIFTVEKRRRIFGIDTDYCDQATWVSDCEECSPDERARLDAAYDETGDVPDGFMRVGYFDTWECVAVYITLDAARDFAAAKGADHRVMVDSGCRNHQWKQLRAFLLALPEPAAPEVPGHG